MVYLCIGFQNCFGIGAGWNQAGAVGNGSGADIQRVRVIGSVWVLHRCFFGAVCRFFRRQLFWHFRRWERGWLILGFSYELKILQNKILHENHLLYGQYARMLEAHAGKRMK